MEKCLFVCAQRFPHVTTTHDVIGQWSHGHPRALTLAPTPFQTCSLVELPRALPGPVQIPALSKRVVNLQIRDILLLFNDSKASETAIKVQNLNELANYATGDIPMETREEALVSEFRLDLTLPDYKASHVGLYRDS